MTDINGKTSEYSLAGGFVPGIVFNPTKKGLAYLRTDIGGVYRLNTADDSWIPLTDYAGDDNWHDWGPDALATDVRVLFHA